MKRSARTALALAAAAAAAALASCGESDTPEPSGVDRGGGASRAAAAKPVAVSTEPVAAFAPLVRIHPDERWFPIGAGEFLSNSTLKWGGGPCQFERSVAASAAANDLAAEPVPPLDVSRLGQTPGYRFRPLRGDCMRRRDSVSSTTMRTAPFDGKARPAGLHPDEGFVLDILTDAQPGERPRDRSSTLTGVPAYYARDPAKVAGRPGLRLSYWLLYGHGARPSPSTAGGLAHHEGDWERFDVLAQREPGRGSPPRFRPVVVRYHSDNRVVTVDWDTVERAGPGATHPVADAAPESHALRPPSRCDRCVEWPTWHDLRDVRRQPWFGYGGAWGSTREPGVAASPPGPSPFNLR